MRACALVLGLAACGGASRPAPGPQPSGGGDRSAAARQVREVVQGVYASLRRGNLDGLHTLATPEVFALGPGPAHGFAARTDALVALTDGFPSGRRHRVTSRDLQITAAASGRSAWLVDRFELDRVPYRLTAVLAETDGLWFVVAVHLSRPVAEAGAAAPAPLPGAVDEAARPAAAELAAAAAAPARYLDQMAGHRDAIALGPGARDFARGARALKRHFAGHAALTVGNDLRAGATPDGALAWVAAQVGTRRVFAVYERQGKSWRLAALHESFAAGG